MSFQVSAKVLPTFPASVSGQNGITITKVNGAYVIGFQGGENLNSLAGFDFDQGIPYYSEALEGFQPITIGNGLSLINGTLSAVGIGAAKIISAAPWDIDIVDGFSGIQNSTGSAIAVNLPDASTKIGPVTIKDALGNFNAYNATLTPNGSDTIDGASGFVMNRNFESVTLQPIPGTGWLVYG